MPLTRPNRHLRRMHVSASDTVLFPPLPAAAPLDAVVEAWSAPIIAIRRHLHMHPEVGRHEVATARYIRAVLEANGLEVQGPVAGTGLYVDIEGALPGRRIGYRADIDALPIQDAKRTAYASQHPGVAHLCGHDAHTTVGIVTALLLDGLRDTLAGTVRVFFQPNEEGTPGGAIDMVADGVLEGLDAAYAIHVDPSLPTGQYGLISGPATAAADLFRVVVRADRTGHSARPHEARDTVWIANQIAQAYYQLVGRITDARNPAVLTICRFHGGEAYNVIPAEVEFGGTVRTTDSEERELLLRQLREIARSMGTLHGTAVDVDIQKGAPPVRNDDRLITHVEGTLRLLYGDAAVHRIPRPSMGGEDFSHYLDHVSGALIRVGTRSGPETGYPLHHACFDLDEYALLPAAYLMSRVLHDHLDQGLLG